MADTAKKSKSWYDSLADAINAKRLNANLPDRDPKMMFGGPEPVRADRAAYIPHKTTTELTDEANEALKKKKSALDYVRDALK